MRRRLRTSLLVAAVLAAAVAAYVALTLPPPALRLDVPRPATHLPGAIHVHSERSDGTGTIAEIAAAAARAGLRFVILSDHGAAIRPPDPPAYRDGVLVIDAVELNTRDGHLVALGLWDSAPYPLGGAARDVVDDVHRLGGVAIAAHPDSPKEELRWRAQNVAVDGLEWLNADSEWRDESTGRLLGGALRSVVRPSEAIAQLFSRPIASLRRWDQASRARRTFAVVAHDAHARIGWREDEEPRQRTALARPSYESMFRTLQQVVVVDTAPSGQAEMDAKRLVDALAAGRSYSVISAFADPGILTFDAARGATRIESGGRVEPTPDPVTFRATAPGAPGARLVLFRNGQQIEDGQGSLTSTRSETGVYRVEAYLPGPSMPWMVSNAITVADPGGGLGRGGGAAPLNLPAFVGQGGRGGPPDSTRAGEVRSVPASGERWSVEHDPISNGRVTGSLTETSFDYALGGGPAYGQYAAMVLGGHDEAGIEEISFTGRALKPMRISVQVRLPGGRDGQRWQRSVYLDQTPRAVVLRLQDFEPVDAPTTSRPIVAPLQALLFVVDTVNTLPATSGRFSISELTLRVNRLQ